MLHLIDVIVGHLFLKFGFDRIRIAPLILQGLQSCAMPSCIARRPCPSYVDDTTSASLLATSSWQQSRLCAGLPKHIKLDQSCVFVVAEYDTGSAPLAWFVMGDQGIQDL